MIDVESDPGAWATAIAHTPHLSQQATGVEVAPQNLNMLIAAVADLTAVTGELLRYAREGAACDSFAIEPETFPQLASAVRILCEIEEPIARGRNDASGAEALAQFRHGAFLLSEEWAA